MSYIIEPMPLISFLEESKLRLPRFQRRATWDKKQNFELAVSVFQDYPVGVVIVNQEKDVAWLLDGRQRRNALILMRNNPVQLYEWAKNYIGFKSTADPLEIKSLYWSKVDRYLESDESELDNDINNNSEEYDNKNENVEEGAEEISFDKNKQKDGLTTLLELILMVHQNKPSGSRWEKLFDFSKFFSQLKYAPRKNDYKIDPQVLRKFILELLKAYEQENEGNCTEDFFVEYYLDNFPLKEDGRNHSTTANESKFRDQVSKTWDDIRESMDIIERSEKVFADARIGVIRLSNAAPLDAQNIFSRINRGGTQLKAEELLSAKPYWNKGVDVKDLEVAEKIKILYKNLGIAVPEPFVRWDIAATLISRMSKSNFVFSPSQNTHEGNDVNMDEISLGFKLLSAIYVQGISKRHIGNLEMKDSIQWTYDIDRLVDDVNNIFKILLNDSFFRFYGSWKMPMNALLGNAVALEFITIMYMDWKEKGKFYGTAGSLADGFKRDARILFDRLIFEYVTKTWRGSSDSKMANDIRNWKNRLSPVAESEWVNFISGACQGAYNGQQMTAKLLRPVLYYYYVINQYSPQLIEGESFDVDHIIPQELFRDNSLVPIIMKDSLINLGLLPKRDNISKGAKRLKEVSNSWLRESISNYEGIKEEDFDKYSDVTHIEDLKNQRMHLFFETFGEKRKAMLIN